MLDFTFNLTKAAQATALLLHGRPARRMSYLRVLKLLYLADREMLTQKLRTITGDQPIAMKKGPVLVHLFFWFYVAALTGHSALRVYAMRMRSDPPGAADFRAMEQALEASLGAGSIGFSTGLNCGPASFSTTMVLPGSTRYCFPPVWITAYMESRTLLIGGDSSSRLAAELRSAQALSGRSSRVCYANP